MEPIEPSTRLSRSVVWFPPGGQWFHFETGDPFPSNHWYPYYGTLSDFPVFAKLGAIVPLNTSYQSNVTVNPSSLEVVLFPGADNFYTLYEDDNLSNDYLKVTHFRKNRTEYF